MLPKANSSNYTMPAFRATMAFEAGEESHVGCNRHTGLGETLLSPHRVCGGRSKITEYGAGESRCSASFQVLFVDPASEALGLKT